MIIKIHPFKQKPLQALSLIIFIIAAGSFFQSCYQGYWGSLAVLLLFFSLSRFFFPTRYIFNETHLEIDLLGRKKILPWSRFKSMRSYPNGIYLSPYIKPKSWEPFRGIFLVLDKDKVIAAKGFIESKIYGKQN